MADNWEELSTDDVLVAIGDSLDDVLLAAAGLEVEDGHAGDLVLKEIATGPDVIKTGRFRVTVSKIPN